MRTLLILAATLSLVVVGGTAAAQERNVRAELTARGAPAGFVERAVAPVERAEREGLPTAPLADKALEGWAKGVPADRVAGALEQMRSRLEDGRRLAQEAGLAEPPGAVVAAAGEALGRGLGPQEVRDLIASSRTPQQGAIGLQVAASLAAQGLEHRAAVAAVRQAYDRDGGQDLFELPSALADLTAQGVPMDDVAQRIMRGGGLPMPQMAGRGPGRPGSVPPTPGGKAGPKSGRRR
jgi:hypothetical protein